MRAKYRVEIIEHEAGWGESVIGTRDFDSLEAADEFRRKYNNKEPTLGHETAPSQYFMAHRPFLIDLDIQQ